MNADAVKLAAPRAAAGLSDRAGEARPRNVAAVTSAALDAMQAPAASVEAATTAAVEANRRLTEKSSELTIEFDDSLGRPIFKIVDTRTGEVVRQIPSEEVLAIARALNENVTSGVLLRGHA